MRSDSGQTVQFVSSNVLNYMLIIDRKYNINIVVFAQTNKTRRLSALELLLISD